MMRPAPDRPFHRAGRWVLRAGVACAIAWTPCPRAPAAGDVAAPATRPAPDLAGVPAAQRRVRERFAADYAKADAKDRRALAEKLLGLAAEGAATEPADRLALLVEARDLALMGRDVPLALRAVQAADENFSLPLGERARLLSAVAEVPEASDDAAAARAMTRRWLALFDAAMAESDHGVAAAIATRAAAAAENAGETLLTAKVADRSDRLVDIIEQGRLAKAAQAKLAADPNDAGANLAVGIYLCSVKGDWDAALPMLAKGSDATLRGQAERELGERSRGVAMTAEGWSVRGEVWAAIGASEKGAPGTRAGAAMRAASRARAVDCFRQALALADAEARPALQRRIADLTGVRLALGPAGADFKALAARAAQPPKRSGALGGAEGDRFDDVPGGAGAPALLAGFRYTTMDWSGHRIVRSLRPLYVAAAGKSAGPLRGEPEGKEKAVEAAEGYAVGGLIVRSGLRVDGFKVVFMRIRGADLDPDDAYESPWIGGQGGGGPAQLGIDGRPILGIHGRAADDAIISLGIVQVP